MSVPKNLPLNKKRVFVLEDEPLIAMEFDYVLRTAGATDVFLCFRLTDDVLDTVAQFDAAVLDLRICGKSSLPVARYLADRKIPFVIVTASAPTDLGASLAHIPLIQKPDTMDGLVETLRLEIAKMPAPERRLEVSG